MKRRFVPAVNRVDTAPGVDAGRSAARQRRGSGATTATVAAPAVPAPVGPGLLETGANSLLAFFLLVATSPLLLMLAAAVLVVDGRPVFYRGVRLGRRQQPFTMYKFRTLVLGAQQVVGGQLLSSGHKLTTRLGGFLRETRLDELPQLVNVLRGDMAFLGPRPERPEVYECLCRNIPDYGRRFDVKPGLIGYSQLFTPHNAPKRLRTLIDNQMVRHKAHPLSDLLLIGHAGLAVIRSSGAGLVGLTRDGIWRRRILRLYREQREQRRVRLRDAWVIVEAPGCPAARLRLLDMSERAFLMVGAAPLELPLPEEFRLEIRIGGRNGRAKLRRTVCTGQLRQVRRGPDGCGYVIDFRPTTPTSHYVVHQHFLRQSLASPPRRRRARRPARQ